MDYDKLKKYIQKPKGGVHYIFQNPIGEIFYLDGLTQQGKTTLIRDESPLEEREPVAVIKIKNSTGHYVINQTIEWDFSNSRTQFRL